MNTINSEIIYATSVNFWELLAAFCWSLCREIEALLFHSLTAPLPTAIIVSVTDILSTCAATSCPSSRLGQTRRIQLLGQHFLDAEKQTKHGWIDTTTGCNLQAASVTLISCHMTLWLPYQKRLSIFINAKRLQSRFQSSEGREAF